MLLHICLLLLLIVGSNSFSTSNFQVTQRHPTQVALFNFGGAASGGTAKIPSSTNDRDNQAIAAVKAAIQNPRDPRNPLIECEFPALVALNKLGDGSLRSTLEAEDANVAFASKLVKGIAPAPFLGPNVALVVSSSASNSFLKKAQKVKGATLFSLRDGIPEVTKEDVCIFLTPSSRNDYQAAKSLAESCAAKAVVVVNGFAKVRPLIFATSNSHTFKKSSINLIGICTHVRVYRILSCKNRIKRALVDRLQWLISSNHSHTIRKSLDF
jgi:hypothetical protein